MVAPQSSGVAQADRIAPIDRLLAQVAAYSVPGLSALPVAAVRRDCGQNRLCAARSIVAWRGPQARLERVQHPDTDQIRWVTSAPSLAATSILPDERLVVALSAFGRTAHRDLHALFVSEAQRLADHGLVIDLRDNSGGDLGRMLRIAELFLTHQPAAFFLRGRNGRESHDLFAKDSPLAMKNLTVLVGAQTASSAELLSALLRRYGKARILGRRTAGKDFLYRILSVDHDWRLLYPAEVIEVPGESLSGGLVPDGPLPADLEQWAPS